MSEPVEAKLFHKIHCCSNLMQRSIKAGGESEQPHRRGQDRLLSILLHRDGISMKEIVHKMDIRPSSAGELVDKLEAQGCAERRNDGKDRRVFYVYLTDEGRRRAAQAEDGLLSFYEGLFSGLATDEKQQLDGLLTKVKLMLTDKQESLESH